MDNRDENLVFDDGYGVEKPHRAMQTFKRMWKSVKEQHTRLYIVLGSVVCYTILSVAAPFYSAGIVNRLWENIKAANGLGVAFRVTWEQGGQEIFLLFLMYLGVWLFSTVQAFMMASFAERLSLRLRTDISEKLNRLPLSYFDRHKTGTILSYCTNDLDKMAEALQTGLLKLFTSTGLIIGSLIMMFYFHAGLTLIFLVFIALSMFVTKLFSGQTLHLAAKRQQCMGNVNALVEEYYTGRTIIKAFGQEESSAKRMRLATEELAETARKADFMINAINPAIRMVNRLGQVCIALAAGKFLIDGVLSVGAFQAFFQYVNQSAEPLTEALYMVNAMQSALASVERIYEFLDEQELEPDRKMSEKVKDAKGYVEFRNVRFGYTKERTLMHDISFVVKPGEKVAIVGSTGAGKTTLVNLLMRFYEVDAGQIFLDGKNTRNLSRKNLRENFGMVLQDAWLFGGTIAENIAYGKQDASREEIIAAAKAARVDFFVRTLPKGYDTILGNDIETISAGQRQLLTIARALLANPSVLILDEATSSVDTRTELEIGKAMKVLMKDRTSFVIAHRLSTIMDADLILVMQNGDIVEKGTHEELIRRGSVYANLYNSQFAGD